MSKVYGTMVWVDSQQVGKDLDEHNDEEEVPLVVDEPHMSLSDCFTGLESQFTKFQESINRHFELSV